MQISQSNWDQGIVAGFKTVKESIKKFKYPLSQTQIMITSRILLKSLAIALVDKKNPFQYGIPSESSIQMLIRP